MGELSIGSNPWNPGGMWTAGREGRSAEGKGMERNRRWEIYAASEKIG